MPNLSNTKQVLLPEVFEFSDIMDAEEWIERFELLGKLNAWSERDQIDLLKLYLGRKEVLWYKKNKSLFTNWDTIHALFIRKWVNQELEIIAWDRIQRLKLSDFDLIEDLQLELEELLIKTKITDYRVKWNCLISMLDGRYKRKVLEVNIRTWKKVIEFIRDSERLDRVIPVEGKTKKIRSIQFETKEEKTIIRMHNRPSGEKDMSKLCWDKAYEKAKAKLAEEKAAWRRPYCYNCRESGHSKYNCPKWIQANVEESGNGNNNNTTTSNDSKVNSLEWEIKDYQETDEEAGNDNYFLEKRLRSESKSEESGLEKKAKKRKEVLEKKNSHMEKLEKQNNVARRKLIHNLLMEAMEYSLKDDLMKMQPSINFGQLLKISPEIRNQFKELYKKVETKKVDEIEINNIRLSNCKCIVNIMGEYNWVVMDTGAACSVINKRLLEKWGVEVDQSYPNKIVTADGTRHETYGKVSQVPVKIAEHNFPVDLVVIDRADDFIVFGIDWFLKYKAVIDMNKEELSLPIEEGAVVLSLSTKDRFKENEDNEELFAIIKEDPIVCQEGPDSLSPTGTGEERTSKNGGKWRNNTMHIRMVLS
ncbi:hypothetical protein BB560_004016 [Smittium megazygosporum]|uniref:CCHC-type domain-containing protein n=1 Tax=Smittium megazygosporum TaxID=133381 RepID=A0A2T9ZAG2_9FUNG|nr:hypothetical protein BB560_004016 [Smittium megazygosporum]